MKKNIILSAALMFFGLTAQAQTKITFDSNDYKAISVYDSWEKSPFRTGALQGNAAVASNPDTEVDAVLGTAPNSTDKVVAFQRSRHGSNTYGVRIDLKEPIRMTKQLQYIHVMTYLKDKPADSRMMVIGLGKRLEKDWNWQTGEDEQFWSITNTAIESQAGWQDIVVSFKGFSYSKEENANSGIDIYSLIIVPDVRSPHADESDWVAYFDEIVIDNNPDKRFTTEKYALTHDKEANISRNDRSLNSVGLTVGGNSYTSTARSKKAYSDNTLTGTFPVTAGAQVKPTFNYTGAWMSAYTYVDWANDGVFKDTLNTNGTPAKGSDVVSYSAVQIGDTWYKSDGSTTANGNTIGGGVPTFTIPEGTDNGFYRMRYKVDWNSIDPAGSNTLISDGGGIVDVMLDVHGPKVIVNASQLNGDIVLASDGRALQNYEMDYNTPLTVKIIPENGFVQYGFTLKYGYNVNAKEQLDENGNPNWIKIVVPFDEINADGTYTIPAEYLRGSNVSIAGDMQQVWHYTVKIVGDNGQGGVSYGKIAVKDGDVLDVTQFFSKEQLTVTPIEGHIHEITINNSTREIKVEYKKIQECTPIASLAELSNEKFYQIKAKSGEGYLAWNSTITDTYLSLRGVTNTSHNGEPSNAAVLNIYKEEVSPFDMTVVWQIIKEGDKYYLYQPAKKEYVTRTGRDYIFTSEKTALDNIRENSGDHAGTFSFHAGGSYSDGSTNFACIVTNEAAVAVRNWTWSDHGSVFYILENPNITTTSIEEPIVKNEASKGIYNLQGQKFSSMPTSGIVIVNNKKVYIK